MKKLIGIFTLACSVAANAAQFIPESGGCLDVKENWSGDLAVLAVAKFQSGPLRISGNGVSLPDGATSLNYWYSVYTNDFGADMVLNMRSKPLKIEYGAELYHVSGGIDAGSSASYVTGTTVPAKFVLKGGGASFSGYQFFVDALGSQPLANGFELLDGASMSLTGAFVVGGGNNAALVTVAGKGTSLASETSLLIGSAMTHGNAVSDAPGVQRSVIIEDGASASFSSGVAVGQQSGGCALHVRAGAELAAGSLVLGDVAPNADAGATNNVMSVSAAQVLLTGSCMVGSDLSAADNALIVTNSAKVQISGDLVVGKNGTGNILEVSDPGSSVSVSGKGFVGGRPNVSGPVAPVCNVMRVDNGAELKFGDDVHVGIVGGESNRIHITSGALFAAKSLSLYSGNTLVVEDAHLALTNGIVMSGSSAAFTNSTVVLGQNLHALVGGDSSSMVFSGCEIQVPCRWAVQGKNFTMRMDDSRLEYTDPNEWFITGGTGAESVELKRCFVFEGARPHLKVSGAKGMFLRGGIELRFNLGESGFPTDRAVVELTDPAAQFSGNDLWAHRVVVNVSDKCPSGTYTLMKGKNCGTFLTGNGAYSVAPERHRLIVATENGIDVLKVRVRNNLGIRIIVR